MKTAADLSTPFPTLVRRLRDALQGPLPGPAAHLTMAPGHRRSTATLSVAGKTCREAGVLALLTEVDGRASVVLTVRRAHLAHHPGQISLPGGRLEPGETHIEAALREAREEVGLVGEVDVLGALSPLFIPPSGFCVTPFVAAVPGPLALTAHEDEVEEILLVPLASLHAGEGRGSETRDLRGAVTTVPFYRAGNHRVWGATAMILAELLAVCFD